MEASSGERRSNAPRPPLGRVCGRHSLRQRSTPEGPRPALAGLGAQPESVARPLGRETPCHCISGCFPAFRAAQFMAIESSHMPRPKGHQLPHRVSVALTEDQFTGIAELAKANGAPVSWVVRRAVIVRYCQILAALALSVCGAHPSWAQTEQTVTVPSKQRALTSILSKYNDLYESAPNDIQRDKVSPSFKKEFCENIPKGSVSGWIGEVSSIDDRSPSKGINLYLGVSTYDLRSGGLGVELSLGNRYAYGVSEDNTQPHLPTIIPLNSALFDAVSNLRSGDTVIFSGDFIPYLTTQSCYDNDTTYFSLFRFSSIRKIGYGLLLH